MRTAVSQSSIDHYHSEAAQRKFSTDQERVLAQVRNNPGTTRKEIARRIDLESSSVAGRANELLRLELIHKGPRRKCSITGISAETLWPDRQGELF